MVLDDLITFNILMKLCISEEVHCFKFHNGRVSQEIRDFHAGVKRQAPGWMQRAGLEWLFRLCSEPRRLWRRYLVGNTRFVLGIVRRRPRLIVDENASR